MRIFLDWVKVDLDHTVWIIEYEQFVRVNDGYMAKKHDKDLSKWFRLW